METTNEILDQIKAKYDLHSDYALAPKLGVTRSGISGYRHSRSSLSGDVAIRAAKLLSLNPGYVLACMEAERAKTEPARSAWKSIAELAKTFGAAAALLLMVAVPSLTPTPAHAAPTLASVGSMYIM